MEALVVPADRVAARTEPAAGPHPRLRNALTVALMMVGLLGVFGPHVAMLAFRVVGARPPAALYYFCVINHHQPARAAIGGLRIHAGAIR